MIDFCWGISVAAKLIAVGAWVRSGLMPRYSGFIAYLVFSACQSIYLWWTANSVMWAGGSRAAANAAYQAAQASMKPLCAGFELAVMAEVLYLLSALLIRRTLPPVAAIVSTLGGAVVSYGLFLVRPQNWWVHAIIAMGVAMATASAIFSPRGIRVRENATIHGMIAAALFLSTALIKTFVRPDLYYSTTATALIVAAWAISIKPGGEVYVEPGPAESPAEVMAAARRAAGL